MAHPIPNRAEWVAAEAARIQAAERETLRAKNPGLADAYDKIESVLGAPRPSSFLTLHLNMVWAREFGGQRVAIATSFGEAAEQLAPVEQRDLGNDRHRVAA